ncbi:MAG: AraC family transcriptional regulator, partial [Spirochaetales bacterium]|nr:AraC family transcriptional regulator [Spirochaetales bacterium]
EKLKDYEVNFPHDGFLLMCFKMDKVEKPIHYETRDKVIKKSIIACLDDDLDAIVVDLEDYYACIVNYPFTEDEQIIKEFKEKVGKFAERAFNKLEEEFSIFISATVSEFHQGIYKLPKTYKEVTGLFEYKKITNNDKRLIFYTDYYISHESWYKFGNTYHKFDEVRKLITSIQVSDFLNAKSLIAELFDNDYSRQYPSLLLARCRKFGIIDAAINAMGLLKNDLDEDFLRELDPTTKIVNCPSYNDLERTLNEIFDAIINYIAEKNKELPPAWFENTMTYIEKHYNDPEINVSAIADHFDINSAYYARVFKKYTGISPLDYIHKLRMKSAKELMGKGLSVKDAASIVGYGNPLTMSRAFKRYEGLTPGSFVKTVVKLPDKLES